MEFIRADTDFCPQAQLKAVVEPRAGVDQHTRGIDGSRKPPGCVQVGGHDRLGVLRTVASDMGNRLLQTGDDRERPLLLRKFRPHSVAL